VDVTNTYAFHRFVYFGSCVVVVVAITYQCVCAGSLYLGFVVYVFMSRCF
jgi:hypothetical protein